MTPEKPARLPNPVDRTAIRRRRAAQSRVRMAARGVDLAEWHERTRRAKDRDGNVIA